MPITYDFPYNRATELNSRPLKQTRYNFTINSTVDDPWDSRFVGPVLNPPFIPNHPIDVRLLSPLVTAAATWDTGDGTNQYRNLVPGYIPENFSISSPFDTIYNTRLNPDALSNIGTIPSNNEANGLAGGRGGVQMFSNGSSTRLNLTNPSTGSANSLDLTNLVSVYSSQIRSQGTAGFTLAMVIMGHNQNALSDIVVGSTMNESNYVTGPDSLGASPFNQEFYRTSSYFAFNSVNNTDYTTGVAARTMISQNIGTLSFRKSFPYKYAGLTFSASNILGLSAANSGAAEPNDFLIAPSSTNFFSSFFSNVQNGYTITINEDSTTGGEVTNATRFTSAITQPLNISATNKSTTFAGLSVGYFRVTIPTADSIFGTFTTQPPYFIRYSGSTTPVPAVNYIGYNADAAAGEPIKIRAYLPASIGTDNYIVLKYNSATEKRFSGGSSNIGLVPGSYIEVSGAVGTNNGIYQVLAIYDGVPDDPNMKFAGGLSMYQILQVNRSITPNESDTITIKNVSHLPVLHIKYREP